MPDIFTVREAATLRGVCPSSIWRMMARGTLPTVSVRCPNGQYQLGIPADALLRYITHRAIGRTKCADLCADDMTIPEVVARTGISSRRPYAWVREEQLPAHTHGTRLVVHQRDLEAFLQHRTERHR